ncbi:MAG: hypothetical protein ACRENS_04120 [Candidatus Eiseniibacteriota bacterium]
MRAHPSRITTLAALLALALATIVLPPAAGAAHKTNTAIPKEHHGKKSRSTAPGTAAAHTTPAVSASSASDSAEPVVTAVRVERIKPERERYPTMRFLKANRDFIRSRFDLLRERPVPESGLAANIDPRFLNYRQMMADASVSNDSLARAEDASRRWELFSNITDLGRLEDQLDLMDRQLADQKVRLGELQRDFTGRQLTSLAVVLSGFPSSGEPGAVTLVFEPGDTLSVELTPEVRQSLQHGGVLELCHRLVEPREQTLAVALQGGAWDASDPGFVTLDPERDQLSFLRLDLSAARPAEGASSMAASRWLNDTGLAASRSPETQP